MNKGLTFPVAKERLSTNVAVSIPLAAFMCHAIFSMWLMLHGLHV